MTLLVRTLRERIKAVGRVAIRKYVAPPKDSCLDNEAMIRPVSKSDIENRYSIKSKVSYSKKPTYIGLNERVSKIQVQKISNY